MAKRILLISCLLLILTSCGVSRSVPSDNTSAVSERYIDTPDVQLAQSLVLPPYGVKVAAEKVVLQISVSTSKKETVDRNKDLQNAIDVISALVTENTALALEDITVTQVSGGYAREESASALVQSLDTTSVKIKLATNLSQHGSSFLKTIADYNEFLKAIDLPDSITIQALSVETELGDLEAYRAQIIERVYQELAAVKGKYDPSVKFEVTGLYDPIKKLQLSDVEYYLYLEPVVKVLEF